MVLWASHCVLALLWPGSHHCRPLRLRSGGCSLCLSDSAVPVSSPDHSSRPVSGVRDQGPLSFPPLQTVWSGQLTPKVCLLVRRMGPTSGGSCEGHWRRCAGHGARNAIAESSCPVSWLCLVPLQPEARPLVYCGISRVSRVHGKCLSVRRTAAFPQPSPTPTTSSCLRASAPGCSLSRSDPAR